MMVNFVTNSFLTLFQFVYRIFKKAICCLKRRRRLSCEPLPLTNIGVIPNVEKDVNSSWNSWDDPLTIVTATKPVDPVQQQIELYRQNRIAAHEITGEEKDFFQDMTPRIVKQKKMFLHSVENHSMEIPSSVSFAPDPGFSSSELGMWEDSQTWEDQAEEDWNADSMIREKRKIDREARLAEQQKKKHERESKVKSLPGTKLS